MRIEAELAAAAAAQQPLVNGDGSHDEEGVREVPEIHIIEEVQQQAVSYLISDYYS